MKKVFVNKIVILCSFICIMTVSCSEDPECQEGTIEVSGLEERGCTNSPYNITVATLNEFELIRNQEDYDLFIDAKCNPDIDWFKYDLIAGMIGLNKSLAGIDKQLVMNCRTNRLILTFTFRVHQTQAAPIISFDALIPKLKDEQDFFVEFQFKE